MRGGQRVQNFAEWREKEFEVEPCLEPKYCVVCWWYVKVAHRREHLNHADILVNGVPVCEEHLSMLLKELYRPNLAIYDFFKGKEKELKGGSEIEVECKPSSYRWDLRARLKVTECR